MTRINTANHMQTAHRLEVGKMSGSDSNDSCGDARREKCFEAGASSISSRREWRSIYSAEEDLVILGEIAAAKAHIAPYGKKLKPFLTAAEKVSENAKFTAEATAKRIFDRYARVQKNFEKNERKICLLSGIEEEIGEAEELPARMKEAKNDAALQARMEKKVLRAQKEEKILKEEELVLLKIENVPHRADAVAESGEENEDMRQKKKRRDNVRLGNSVFTEEVDRFADLIYEFDGTRITLGRRRLLFEQKCFEQEIQKWEKESMMSA